MKEVIFNPNGAPLWLKIEMEGVYIINYLYQLWAAKKEEPPVLTQLQGNNFIPHDDTFKIVNDKNPGEHLSNHKGRVVDILFTVIKNQNKDDNGYRLKATVLQGDSPDTATVLKETVVPAEGFGTVGSLNLKDEPVSFLLKTL